MKDETTAMKAELHPSSFIPHPSKDWSGRRDLNSRPSPWQGDALPLSYSRFSTSFDSKDSGWLVKAPNCLTKNLLEMDSLPQIKNLLEMSEISPAAKESGGVKDEVNDERKKAHRGGHSRAVSAGAQERENRHLE